MSEHIAYQPDQRFYGRYNQSWINATLRLIKSRIKPERPTEKPKVLDIGCGRGEILGDLSLAGFDCFGIDFDEQCVKLSQKYGEVFCADVSKIDSLFEEDFFDVVVMVHVLEHTVDPAEAIEKMKRVAKNYVVIAVPNLSSSSTFWHGLRMREPTFVNKGHRFGWDPGHFKTFLEVTCRLRILEWMPDRVIIPSRVSLLLQRAGILEYLELHLLPRLFPLLSNSLIVLCEKG